MIPIGGLGVVNERVHMAHPTMVSCPRETWQYPTVDAGQICIVLGHERDIFMYTVLVPINGVPTVGRLYADSLCPARTVLSDRR